jgi:hypothetical protein
MMLTQQRDSLPYPGRRIGLVLMRRATLFLAVVLSIPALLPAVAHEYVLPKVDYSATAVHEAGAALKVRETIHYAGGKLRIDRGNGFSSTILDLNTQTQYLLMVNRTYLVLPMDDELFRRYIARTPETTASRKLGKQRIEGLETTKYAFGEDGALDAAGTYWLTATGIMVRREYESGVFGHSMRHLEFLTDITFSKQPATLFSIPPGYKPAK